MRAFPFAAITVAGLALAGCTMAVAQSAPLTEKSDRLNGYVDLKTGAFHPAIEAAASPETTVTYKTFTGSVDVTITSTISTSTAKALPKGYTILCDVDLTAQVDGFSYTEVSASPATVSGETATCTVNIPYSWTGASGGVSTSYFFTGIYKVTATYVSGGATQPLTDFNVIRQATGPLTNSAGLGFALPASGTTTTVKLDATL